MEGTKKDKLVPIGEAASILGVSVDTLRRWDERDILKSSRPDGKDRYFSYEQIQFFLHTHPLSMSEAARELGITKFQLNKLAQSGQLVPKRNQAGERYYSYDQLKEFSSIGNLQPSNVRSNIFEDKSGRSNQNDSINQLKQSQLKFSQDLGNTKEPIEKLLNFRRKFIFGGFSVLILFLSLVILFTVLFIVSPKKTADFFGFYRTKQNLNNGELINQITRLEDGRVLGAEYQTEEMKTEGGFWGAVLKPVGGLSLAIVKEIDQEAYNEALPIPPIKDVNDIFSISSNGDISANYNLTLPDTSYLHIPDKNLINNLNAEYVDGRKPGNQAGDLAYFDDNNQIIGLELANESVNDKSLSTITSTGKVAGSAVQLNSAGGLENKNGLTLKTSCQSNQILVWNGQEWICKNRVQAGASLAYDDVSGVLSINYDTSRWDNSFSHLSDTSNPHQVTASQVVPSQTGNSGKVLGTNGSSVSWVENTSGVDWGGIGGTLTNQSDLTTVLDTKVNQSRTINGYALSSNITLSKTDFSLSNVDDVQQLPLSYLDTDGTLSANSDSKVPSQKAVKTYADTKESALTKGTLSGSGAISVSASRQVIGGAVAISIIDAIADGSTKGAASFTASDFNSSSGLISIDYTNGQAASSSDKGFLTSTDWSTFNSKQDALGFTAVPSTRTINGYALSSNITLSKTDFSLSNVDDVQQLPLSYLDTDGTLSANSDSKVPSQKAVKTYAEPVISSGTSLQYFRGDKTWQTLDTLAVTENGSLYFTNARVDSRVQGQNYAITGAWTFNSTAPQSSVTPTNANDLTNKTYVDSIASGIVPQSPVINFYDPTGGLPGSPTVGDRYIASATANGWTINYIYEYNGASWDESGPSTGWSVYVTDLTANYGYNGSGWVLTSTAPAHNTLSGLQGGTSDQYYHLTSAQYTIMSNTSGTNSGDETQSTIKTKLGAASSGVDGYLTGTDWSTFNSKQNALGFTAVPNTRTVNSKALSGDITLSLASSDFADQGTTTTILHGNAAGNPSWSAIVTDDITNNNITIAKIQQIAAYSILGNNTGSSANAIELNSSQVKSMLSLGNVENTALSTWAGTSNITTLGTITTGIWSGTTIADAKIASALTGKTYNGLTITNSTGTLTITDGKTLSVSNTLTFTGTDSSSIAFGGGGTVIYTSNNLSALASTTSAQLAEVISNETGSGLLVFGTSPTLTTPTLGVASATSLDFGNSTSRQEIYINHSGNYKYGIGFDYSAGLYGRIQSFISTGAGDEGGFTWGTISSADGVTFSQLMALSISGHLTIEGVTSTGATGTGKLVFDTSPTLVTPTIGAASATSITIGANTLNTSEWAYLDGSDQGLKTTDSPKFTKMALGTVSVSDGKTLYIGDSTTTNTGYYESLRSTFNVRSDSASDVVATGNWSEAGWASNSSGLSAQVRGALMIGATSESYSGNLGTLIGVRGLGRHRGQGDVTDVYGVQGRVENDDSGTEGGGITNAVSLQAEAYTDKTTGTVTNRYGLSIQDTTGGGNLTNQYGIYIEDLDAATTNRAMYFAGTSGLSRQGIWWNGDTNLYRSAADTLKTDDALSVSGHTTFEGVTSTGATGTGKLVYDTSPTFSNSIRVSSLTADSVIFADADKNLTSVSYTGTSHVVRATDPQLGSAGFNMAKSATGISVLGSVLMTSSVSDSTAKYGYLRTMHYDTDATDFLPIYMYSNSTDNILGLGGGSGSYNAGTRISFYTAANNTTLTGTERVRINSSGSFDLGTNYIQFGSAIGSNDTNLYRSGANALKTDDSFQAAGGYLSSDGTAGATVSCSTNKGIKSVTIKNGLITAATCTTNDLTDMAENYGTSDASISTGDLVSASTNQNAYTVQTENGPATKAYVEKTTTTNSQSIIGIVSANPEITLGENLFKASENPRPVALAGRVSVKVSSENGTIKRGDLLSVSSIPGVAAKANDQSSVIIGTALEDFSGVLGTVIAFVNISHKLGSSTIVELASTGALTVDSLTVDGETVFKGVIKGNDNFAGQITLPAGQTEVRISRNWPTVPLSITVTPSYQVTAWTEAVDKTGFTVKVDIASPTDQTISWLVILSQ